MTFVEIQLTYNIILVSVYNVMILYLYTLWNESHNFDKNRVILEINNRKFENYTLSQWIKEELTMKIRKHFEMNENKNITYQNI